MEDLKDLLYDDVEAKLTEIKDKKERRKKKLKYIKKYSILTLVLLGIVYFLSDYSKVKSLHVSGNKFYRDEQVYNIAGVTFETRYLLMPSFYIKWKLESDMLIKDVSVHKNMSGAIEIELNEQKIIGYTVTGEGEEASTVVVLADGTQREVSEDELQAITYYPMLIGFDEEQMLKLATGFNQEKQEVTSDLISMISEIRAFSTSYNEHMVKITMQDGNRLYCTYDGIRLLTHYKDVVSRLKDKKVCLMMDEANDAITKSDCLD